MLMIIITISTYLYCIRFMSFNFFEIYLKGILQEELTLVMQTLEGHKLHTQKSQNLCEGAVNKTSCIHTACYKLSTSLKQVLSYL